MKFTDEVEARGITYGDRHFKQRPEAVESYFVMWRLTKDPKYREWGWKVVEALDKHSRTDAGYAGIKDVYQIPTEKDTSQESFFLGKSSCVFYKKFLFI